MSRNEPVLPELAALTKLEELNLDICKKLTALPELQRLTNLQRLAICECIELTALPELQHLTRLEALHMVRCDKLTALPGLPFQKLVYLNLSGCDMLRLPQKYDIMYNKKAICDFVTEHLPRHLIWLRAIDSLCSDRQILIDSLNSIALLAVLFATATFTAFTSPPGDIDTNGNSHFMLAFGIKSTNLTDNETCNSWEEFAPSTSTRRRLLSTYFVSDQLSFVFSIAAILVVISATLPMSASDDAEVLAMGVWLSVFFASLFLSFALALGVVAFFASAFAVYPCDRYWELHGPLVVAIGVLGLLGIAWGQRIFPLFPGDALLKYIVPRSSWSRWNFRKTCLPARENEHKKTIALLTELVKSNHTLVGKFSGANSIV